MAELPYTPLDYPKAVFLNGAPSYGGMFIALWTMFITYDIASAACS
jgi:hypothetical protein